jgi:hypothetical protein
MAAPAPATGQAPQVAASYARLPLHFVENRGQTSRQIGTTPGPGYGLYFSRTGVVFTCRAAALRWWYA